MFICIGIFMADLPDFKSLIKEKSPAVVKINTVAKSRQQANPFSRQQDIPDIFRHFFEPRQRQERNLASVGSGFFIHPMGISSLTITS